MFALRRRLLQAKVMLAFRSCINWEVMRTYVFQCTSAHVGFHSNSLLSILCVRQVPASVAATLSASKGARQTLAELRDSVVGAALYESVAVASRSDPVVASNEDVMDWAGTRCQAKFIGNQIASVPLRQQHACRMHFVSSNLKGAFGSGILHSCCKVLS